jgi:hypothetical protein
MSSTLVSNNVALTSDLRYSLKPSSVSARQYRVSLIPSNKQTFSPTDPITLYIPARRNTFIDTKNSYLRFTINNNNATATAPANSLNCDRSAACVFDRLEIFHGSNRLESIQQYNVLSCLLLDVQSSVGKLIGADCGLGTGGDAGRLGCAINATKRRTFTMPIISGIIGSQNEKFLNCSMADDLRVEFTLANQVQGMVAYTATSGTVLNTWTVSGVSLELSVIELSDTGMNMLQQAGISFNDNIYSHISSWQNYLTSLSTGAVGPQSQLLSSKFASLKALVTLPRRNVDIANQIAYSTSARFCPSFASVNYKIGMSNVPQQDIELNGSNTGGYAEAWSELMKIFHPLSSTDCAGAISAAHFNVCDSTSGTGDSNIVTTITTAVDTQAEGASTAGAAFACGVDLEQIHRSDVIISGTSTLNSNCFFECYIDTALTTPYTLSHFALYDGILVLTPYGQYEIRY